MTTQTPAYHFGQALAIIDRALPQGLTPAAISNAMALPATHFGRLIREAMPHMTPRLDKAMRGIVDNVQDWPRSLTQAQQGECHLGWHNMRSRLQGGEV